MHRNPYVGEGADGARRSAEIDRNEADTFDPGEDRDRCLASAERWEQQAAEIERQEPTLTEYVVDFTTVLNVRVRVAAADEDVAADLAHTKAEDYLATVIGNADDIRLDADLDGKGADNVQEVTDASAR